MDSAGSPPPRVGHALGVDPREGAVFLFGGMHAPPLTLYCDTWRFAEGRWTRVDDGSCVTDRGRNASLVYHEALGSMLLLEGPAAGGDTVLRPLRIWRWRGGRWVLADSAGPRRTGFGAAVYDPVRRLLVVPVLFGGPDAGVWEWDGQAWRRSPDVSPAPRQTYGLAYDAAGGRILLVGGQGSGRGSYYDYAWSWDGSRWSRLPQPAHRPSGRAGATLVSDPARHRLYYFGGYDTAPLGQLWILDSGTWKEVPLGE